VSPPFNTSFLLNPATRLRFLAETAIVEFRTEGFFFREKAFPAKPWAMKGNIGAELLGVG
jgi:hypothetical protein